MTEETQDPFTHRLLLGGVSTFIFVMVTYLSQHPTLSWIFLIVLMALVAVGQIEYYRLAQRKDLSPGVVVGVAASLLYLLALFLHFRFSGFLPLIELALGAGLLACFLSFFTRSANAIANSAVTLFGIVYLAIPLGFALAMVYHPFQQIGHDGRAWLLATVFITKMTDIGGYAIGKTLGRTPLSAAISPKKTVEGALGGILLSLLVSGLLAVYYLDIPLAVGLGLGLVISLLAQIGDLAESLLKRDAGVKDSNTLPGLGGILDILDSLIFTIPFVYFFMLYWYR